MANDKKIIKELKLHKSSAFFNIYEKYKNLVYYQAYLILNNKEDAEDISQNVFLKFMNNVDNMDNDSNIKQLLSTISKNEAIDLYRKKSKNNTISIDDVLINTMESKDNKESDIYVISTLNYVLEKSEAQIMTFKIVFDYSFKEIAEEFNLSIGKVQATYYSCLKKLKAYYKGCDRNEL